VSGDEAERLVEVKSLGKTFKTGFFQTKAVEAVKDVSFEVRRGEIFGFLGPNGAGKTTTIKVLTGLIAPTRGEAFLFGRPASEPRAREKLGFLPENPYVYPYLTPREFVEMSGRLSGLGGSALAKRASEALELVKIAYAADRQVRRLSKGMLQRTGLAAALVADPEMLILDEPMSGLDPVGRKEVRDLIFAERDRGRTVFFSTHILGDVEAMCDRVAILREGRVVVSGAIRQLLRGDVLRTDIVLASVSDELRQRLADKGWSVQDRAGVVVVDVEGEAHVGDVLGEALAGGAKVIEVVPRRETLEDLFLRRALGAEPNE
jgi:ABC-2 type transport system ATP-binding protein